MEKVTINKNVKIVGHLEQGFETKVIGDYAHSEGVRGAAAGDYSHSEGYFMDLYEINNLQWSGVVDEAVYKAESSVGLPIDYEGLLVCKGNKCAKIADYSYSGGVITVELDTTLETLDEYIETHVVDACEDISDTVVSGVTFCVGTYGFGSHREGNSMTSFGEFSHVEGVDTIAGSDAQHVSGRKNIIDNDGKYAVIVGNGETVRSNANTIDWEGNNWNAKDVACQGTSVDNAPYKLSDIHSMIDSDWGYVGY